MEQSVTDCGDLIRKRLGCPIEPCRRFLGASHMDDGAQGVNNIIYFAPGRLVGHEALIVLKVHGSFEPLIDGPTYATRLGLGPASAVEVIEIAAVMTEDQIIPGCVDVCDEIARHRHRIRRGRDDSQLGRLRLLIVEGLVGVTLYEALVDQVLQRAIHGVVVVHAATSLSRSRTRRCTALVTSSPSQPRAVQRVNIATPRMR